MIVRNMKDAVQTDRRVVSKTWESVRLLLKDDKMGFSFHITTMFAGTVTEMCYRHHLESVYCISGRGSILDKATGQLHPIVPGTIYILDKHDAHVVTVEEDLIFACVFNPPVIGNEVHDETGAYPILAEAG